jgi:hypothetical protein
MWLRLLILAVLVASALSWSLQARQVVAQVNVMDMQTWTPQAVLTVAAVIFSFGVSWQTIRVHGRVLRDFEAWRKEHVDPKLAEHDTDISLLQDRVGGVGPHGRRR